METTEKPVGKLDNLIDVIEFCRTENLPADRVGRWIWIKFDAKPDQDIREKLKIAGFHWIPRRGEWAHNCGKPSRHGVGKPRDKYPVEAVA